MKNDYPKQIYLAVLYEQCNKSDETVKALESYINSENGVVDKEIKNFLSVAYKNRINKVRNALRITKSHENKLTGEEDKIFLSYTQEYNSKLENELTKICKETILFIDLNLIPNASKDEDKAYFYKLKGDYNRYIAEFAKDNLLNEATDMAKKAYQDGIELIKEKEGINPVKLGLALNYSVFLHEICKEPENAKEVGEKAIKEAEIGYDKLEENEENYETFSIFNMLKENLEMWEKEENNDKKVK